MLTLSITNEQKVHVKLAPVTASGEAATVDGIPVWTVVSGAGTVVADADGMGAFLVSTDTIDGVDTVYKVDADADLGPGVIDIQDTITLTTVHAQAQSLGLTADTPVSK